MLSIYRLLVQAGHRGLTFGEIGKRLGIAPTTLNHHFRVTDSFKTVCEQIELFRATVLHEDRLPFKIRTISLDFLGRAVQSSEFPERVLGNGLVIAEMDEFCFFPGKPDSSQFRLNRLNNGSAETAVGHSLSARQSAFRLTSTVMR